MKPSNLLRLHGEGAVNSVSGRVEATVKRTSQNPISVAETPPGFRGIGGMFARIAPTNHASKRADESAARKLATSTLIRERVKISEIMTGAEQEPVQPRVIESRRLGLIQPLQGELSLDAVIGHISSNPWSVIAGALEEWADLKEGWDGDDAEPIPQIVLDTAKAFCEMAQRYNIVEPEPYINADGEIGFIWDSIKSASVSFNRHDRFLAFCPREGEPDYRMAGPLDVAVCSPSLFESLRDHTVS